MGSIAKPWLMFGYFNYYTTQIRKSWDSMENANKKKESIDF